MTVDIDPNSGFCNGVVRAIRMAEDELCKEKPLYSLGDIVHNEPEVQRLSFLGMKTLNHCDLQGIDTDKILIRAHGEPPKTYNLLAEKSIKIIDATCPVVVALQKKVHKAYLRAQECNGQVVIFGKPNHAEVNGLVGQTNDTAIVLSSPENLEQIEPARPIFLFSQTTMSLDGLQKLRENIEQLRREQNVPQDVPFEVNDTICRQVSNRAPQLIEFAKQHDVIIFVSGSKSSNGKALFAVCSQANPRSYLVSSAAEIDKKIFRPSDRIGVCGATSTPRWLMEEIAAFIQA